MTKDVPKSDGKPKQPWYRMTVIEYLCVVAVIAIVVSLALPSPVRVGHDGTHRQRDSMKVISLALFNYESTYMRFPDTAIRDDSGKPLLSWRVQLLPYLEFEELYNEFHLDEPWDSEHNKKLIPRMPAVYMNYFSKSDTFKTCMLLPVSVGVPESQSTMFSEGKGRTFKEMTGKTTETIMLVTADETYQVVWTKPGDLPFNPEAPAEGIRNGEQFKFMAVMANGSCQLIPEETSQEKLLSLFTCSGNDPVEEEE